MYMLRSMSASRRSYGMVTITAVTIRRKLTELVSVKRGQVKFEATLIGFTAILMWSFLALFTAASGNGAAVPAFGDLLCHRQHSGHRRAGPQARAALRC